MVRSPKYSFIQFTTLPLGECCIALPVSDVSNLAFFVYADFKFKIGVKNSVGQITQDATQTYDWFGTCVDGKNVNINISNILQCGECFNLVLLDGVTVKAISNTFQYLCDTEYTSVVEYLLYGAGFEWDCPACQNRVRLPLYLTEPQYPQEQEVYKLKSGYRRHLFAEIEKTYVLKTDFLTDELHKKLVIALSHDEVYINDILLTKSESYSIDWGNVETINGVKYAMASASMVENVTARNDNCGECSIEGDTCDFEWLETDAVCQLAPVDVTETVEFKQYTCAVGETEVLRTNQTNGAFYSVALGQNWKLYFGGYDNNGIWYLDDDGQIKQTNKTDGFFYYAAIAQNGKLYFCGYDNIGIWYLDNDGTIKQTNKTDGFFHYAAIGQNGKLYFCEAFNSGIWYLDDDDTIKQTNKTNGWFYSAAIGQNGKLYFGGTYYGSIWYLDDDDTIKQTNKTDGFFYYAAIGQNGKLYFCGYDDNGIWYLDNDEQIKQTNKTDERFYSAAIGQNGKLYFGSADENGIWFLDGDGQIKQTNKTDGSFMIGEIGQDGKLYFCNIDGIGIWYLDHDDTIKQTNRDAGLFYYTAIGQDGKLYFCSNSGIFYLSISEPGVAFAKQATFKRYEDAELVLEETKSLLTDVAPTLTEPQYKALSDVEVAERADAVVELFDPETTPEFLSEPITERNECYPSIFEINHYAYLCQFRQNGDYNTGKAVAQAFDLIEMKNGQEWERYPYNMTNMFGTYPAITIAQLRHMSNSEFTARAEALVQYARQEREVSSVIEFKNQSLIENLNMCPIPPHYNIIWEDYICQKSDGGNTGHALGRLVKFIDSSSGEFYTGIIESAFGSYIAITDDQYAAMTDAQVIIRANACIAAVKDNLDPGSTFSQINNVIIEDLIACPLPPPPPPPPPPEPKLFTLTWDDWVCQKSGADNTGNAFALQLMATSDSGGAYEYQILNAFGSYSAITEAQYVAMTDQEVTVRGLSLDQFAKTQIQIAEPGDVTFTVINHVAMSNHTLCPVPPPPTSYTLSWTSRVCQKSGSDNTGNAVARILLVTNDATGHEDTQIITTAFPSYPQITEAQYVAMTDAQINARASAFIAWIESLDLYQPGTFTETGAVIIQDQTLCPLPTPTTQWLSSTMQSSADWIAVAFGNGRFVAVAFNSAIAAYSENGIDWIPTSLPRSQQWSDVTYGNGKFVAVSINSSYIAHSPDGVNWTEVSIGWGNWIAIAYGDGRFVTISNADDAAKWSDDLTEWHSSQLPFSTAWKDITYGNSVFIAIASSVVVKSSDGLSWSSVSMSESAAWQSIGYGNGMFVIVNNTDVMVRSQNETTWQHIFIPQTREWEDMIFGSGVFMMVAEGDGSDAYDPGSSDFEIFAMPGTRSWCGIAFGNGRFVAVARNTATMAYLDL